MECTNKMLIMTEQTLLNLLCSEKHFSVLNSDSQDQLQARNLFRSLKKKTVTLYCKGKYTDYVTVTLNETAALKGCGTRKPRKVFFTSSKFCFSKQRHTSALGLHWPLLCRFICICEGGKSLDKAWINIRKQTIKMERSHLWTSGTRDGRGSLVKSLSLMGTNSAYFVHILPLHYFLVEKSTSVWPVLTTELPPSQIQHCLFTSYSTQLTIWIQTPEITRK